MAFTPLTTQAAGNMTQGETLRWFAHLTGSTVADANLVGWAGEKGLNPNGGWNLGADVTDDDMALLLVQLFGTNPKKHGGNLKKSLQRDGINVDGGEDGLISRSEFVGMVDSVGFLSRLTKVAQEEGSFLLPSGFTNPNNPHFGVPLEQLPGYHGRANALSKGGGGNRQ